MTAASGPISGRRSVAHGIATSGSAIAISAAGDALGPSTGWAPATSSNSMMPTAHTSVR